MISIEFNLYIANIIADEFHTPAATATSVEEDSAKSSPGRQIVFKAQTNPAQHIYR